MQTITDSSPALPIKSGDQIERLFIANFGVSSEQFKRELEAEFEQATPEEQAEFRRLVDEANAALPAMHAAVDRMSENLNKMSATIDEIRVSMIQLDVRVKVIEDRVGSASAAEPLPFRGGVGVGHVGESDAPKILTAPTPGSVPEGEG